jgi:hypothetical protein
MIDYLGGFIQKNLIVFMAIVLLPLKWVVVRLCRDREGEAVALMSVPEDLCYVALGLVMGTSSTAPALYTDTSRAQTICPSTC